MIARIVYDEPNKSIFYRYLLGCDLFSIKIYSWQKAYLLLGVRCHHNYKDVEFMAGTNSRITTIEYCDGLKAKF